MSRRVPLRFRFRSKLRAAFQKVSGNAPFSVDFSPVRSLIVLLGSTINIQPRGDRVSWEKRPGIRTEDREEMVSLPRVAGWRSRQLVREWAREAGYDVSCRGRESDVVDGGRDLVS
jgi:hypothetical protein